MHTGAARKQRGFSMWRVYNRLGISPYQCRFIPRQTVISHINALVSPTRRPRPNKARRKLFDTNVDLTLNVIKGNLLHIYALNIYAW